MQELFESYLKTKTSLPDDAIRSVYILANERTLRRNENILSEGEICRHKVFIAEGLLRTYNTGTNGNEHILQFSPELTWTLDAESYDREKPTNVNIAAVEPSRILYWHKTDFDRLLKEYPLLKLFSEQLISHNMHYSRQRIMTALSATPEEKYDDFVNTFPGYLSRLPLHMIASYLGISLKTLTRIRHNQLHR